MATQTAPHFSSIDDWIARASIPFSLDNHFGAAVDQMMATLDERVCLLGLGEALHSGDEFLRLRNRMFQRLVEAHGYRAIAMENNDVRAYLVDDYINGRGPASYEDIQDNGFTLGIGRWDGNRELVEWMRAYNADPSHTVKLNYYGTLASDQETIKSPRATIAFALDYLQGIDPAAAAQQRARIEPLLGADADWETSATAFAQEIAGAAISGQPLATPAGSEIGISPRAQQLWLALGDLSLLFDMRRAELMAHSDADSFGAARRSLTVARNLLALHGALARRDSLDTLVTMRDAMAAEQLEYIADREHPRGKVMLFTHSIHQRRTRATLPWYTFWPTGAILSQVFGPRFASIGGAVGESEGNFISPAEPGTLEGRLMARGTNCFLPTWRGAALPPGVLAGLEERSGSARPYVPYTPLLPSAFTEYDVIAFLRTVTFTQGADPHPG